MFFFTFGRGAVSPLIDLSMFFVWVFPVFGLSGPARVLFGSMTRFISFTAVYFLELGFFGP